MVALGKWLKRGGDQALPERVRQSIREQEDQTERLIGWIQLTVVLTFSVLYTLAPKTFSEQAEFAPVPWALGIYLALTVIRIVWSYVARLPNWSLTLSVVFDMTLLMVLIWSFHIQYEQPPSFYLKAPTLLYAFIFIALRALRFEAQFVLIAGIAAAAGWGVMIAYVLYSDADSMMITRDYVAYMTSNAILLGAEFDKMISILMVAGILAMALTRGRRLLIRSVTESLAARELSRFFAPEVAARIKGADQEITAGHGELREAAIVMLDMRGFTRLAHQVPPHEAMQMLAGYQSRLVPVLGKHGGSIDKFLGDGILATFGAAEPSESAAADALKAAEAAIREAEAWRSEVAGSGARKPPEVNASIASGRILFGAVGEENRLEFTVIGDAVNLAAKLDKQNKVAGVKAICDAATYERALKQGFPADPPKRRLEAQIVTGVEEPLDLVVVVE